MENNFNDPRTYVLDMERKGFVVVDTKDGLQTISLSDLAHKDTTSLLATCSRDLPHYCHPKVLIHVGEMITLWRLLYSTLKNKIANIET